MKMILKGKGQLNKTNWSMEAITIRISLADIPRDTKEIVINIGGDMRSSGTHVADRSGMSFSNFMEETARQMRGMGRTRTSEIYLSALNRFKRYQGDISLDDINRDMMEAYETHLRHCCLMPNTIAFYMRTLRAAYNRAVAKGLTCDRKPFANLHTALGNTEKRAVSADCLRRLAACKPNSAAAEFARDMFLFSFYTRGMAWIDMAFLHKSDIRDGQLTYCRRKTGQRLTIKWDGRMQRLVDKHPGTGDYLLPIITKPNGKERNQSRYLLYKTNLQLKALSQQLGLERRLTMYVARHSWASIARALDIPTHIISSGMGHNSEKTTMIYMKTLNASAIDEANRRIMEFIE